MSKNTGKAALVYIKSAWKRRAILILVSMPLFFVYIAVICYKSLEEDMPYFFSDLIDAWKGR